MEGKRFYYFFFILYLLIVSIVYYLQNRYQLDFSLVKIFKAGLSALGIASFFVILINKYLWRFYIFRKILKIDIPYINGRWEGYILSSFTKHKERFKVSVEITQTLNKIHIWYYDRNAYSYSLVADISSDQADGPSRLYVIYRNIPITNKNKDLQPHNGVMELTIQDGENKISGIYYNNHFQRQTYGEIFLRFVSRKKLKSL